MFCVMEQARSACRSVGRVGLAPAEWSCGGRHAEHACCHRRATWPRCWRTTAMRRRLSHQPRIDRVCAAPPLMEWAFLISTRTARSSAARVMIRTSQLGRSPQPEVVLASSAASPDFSTPLVTRATQAGTRPPNALLTSFVRSAGHKHLRCLCWPSFCKPGQHEARATLACASGGTNTGIQSAIKAVF
jgi:hypothetical protein